MNKTWGKSFRAGPLSHLPLSRRRLYHLAGFPHLGPLGFPQSSLNAGSTQEPCVELTAVFIVEMEVGLLKTDSNKSWIPHIPLMEDELQEHSELCPALKTPLTPACTLRGTTALRLEAGPGQGLPCNVLTS